MSGAIDRIIPAGFGVLALGAIVFLPAGPAAACSRTFNVFFVEPGSANISHRGAQIVEAFVGFFRDRRLPGPADPISCGPLPPGNYGVVVLAHADDPGTRNQCALSFARGHAVRAHLAALGIPEASIAVEVFGDRRKLILTEAGARDVQNRRVELRIVGGGSVEERSPYPRLRNRPEGACPEPRQ